MDLSGGNVELNKDNRRNASIDEMRQEEPEPTDAMRQDSWHTGNCAHCTKEFKRRTVWQKYCCDDCRKLAYEVRTGKQWRKH